MGASRQNRRLEGFRQAAQALLAVGLFAVTASAQTPVVNPAGIVNAADFRPASLSGGAVAQGSIFSVFGPWSGTYCCWSIWCAADNDWSLFGQSCQKTPER